MTIAIMNSAASNGFDVDMVPVRAWPEEVKEFEPVYGWFQRLAACNSALSTPSLCYSLGLEGKHFHTASLLDIASQIPTDYRSLEQNSPVPTDFGYLLRGHPLPPRFINKGVRRVCPTCLEESRHYRVWWDIAVMDCCPLHDSQLIYGLPGDPVDWRKVAVGMTQEGVLIDDNHAISKPASELEKYVLGLLAGNLPAEYETLCQEELSAVLAASVTISRLHTYEEQYRHTPQEINRHANAGFSALNLGYDAIVKQIRSAPWLASSKSDDARDAKIRQARQIISALEPSRLRELIVEAYAQVRAELGLASEAGPLRSHACKQTRRLETDLAKDLGLTRRQIRKVAIKAGVDVNRRKENRAVLLTEEDAQLIRQALDRAIPADKIANSLGCNESELDQLVSARAIKIGFRKDGVRYFFGDDREAITKLDLSPPGKLRNEKFTLREFASRRGYSLSYALTCLRAGRSVGLVSIDPGVPFFDAVVVARFRTKHAGRRRKAARLMTKAKAKALTGARGQTLEQLQDLGLIRSRTGANGQEMICCASVEQFRRRYARASLYGKALEVDPRAALKQLAKFDVSPINEWSKRIVSFVDKEEVFAATGIELDSRPNYQLLESVVEKLMALEGERRPSFTIEHAYEDKIFIEAVSRRWSFYLNLNESNATWEIEALFDPVVAPGRYRRFRKSGKPHQEIWKGAVVQKTDGDGFKLVDPLHFNQNQEYIAKIAERILRRAEELYDLS